MGTLGAVPAFWLNGASFLAVVGSLLVLRAQQVKSPAGEGRQGGLREGFRYVAAQPRILDLLLFTGLLTFFLFTIGQLLPALVSRNLHSGAESFGLLMGASGAGALVSGAAFLPLVRRMRRVGLVLSVAVAWSGAWIVLVAISPWMWLSLTAMFFGSFGAPVVMSSAGGLLEVLAPPTMRARVLSIWFMVSLGL